MARNAPDSRVGRCRPAVICRKNGAEDRAAWGKRPVTTLSFQKSAARLHPSYPGARGGVSKSHQQRVKNKKVEFASLLRRFRDEYGDAYEQLAEQLKASYPELTEPGIRTGQALRNICFFIWCSIRDDDQSLIPTLFRAAVLLSAQDDYFDNSRIPAAEKESFGRAINDALRSNAAQAAVEQSPQLQELAS